MPRMNGVVATQLLRHAGIRLPIIAVTGNALAEDVQAFMMAGAEAVLTKPVRRQLLCVMAASLSCQCMHLFTCVLLVPAFLPPRACVPVCVSR
jgi:CheY-like chemotaxis protein